MKGETKTEERKFQLDVGLEPKLINACHRFCITFILHQFCLTEGRITVLKSFLSQTASLKTNVTLISITKYVLMSMINIFYFIISE